MRAYPAEFELVAPRTLCDVLSILAREPGGWLPIAGGTDVMVQYSAGKLPGRKLVSIWNLPELRRIEVAADEIQIGAGCTYTVLREHEVINRELRATDIYWRACNYLSLGMIYLLENPLLAEPLRPEHIKNRLLWHWGSSPGLSFIYVHLNRLIKKYDLDMIFLAGPGHGAPGVLGPAYLEGTYSEVYPEKSQDV